MTKKIDEQMVYQILKENGMNPDSMIADHVYDTVWAHQSHLFDEKTNSYLVGLISMTDELDGGFPRRETLGLYWINEETMEARKLSGMTLEGLDRSPENLEIKLS